MKRERMLQVAVGLLGILYVALIYPLCRDLARTVDGYVASLMGNVMSAETMASLSFTLRMGRLCRDADSIPNPSQTLFGKQLSLMLQLAHVT